jgi:hypothetical protein
VPLPPLPQFEPAQVPPRVRGGPNSGMGTSGPVAPNVAPSGYPSSGAAPTYLHPGVAIPGAVGPTSVGGPSGPAPLVPPANAPSRAPSPTPAVAPIQAPHDAPDAPEKFSSLRRQRRCVSITPAAAFPQTSPAVCWG